MGFRDRQRERWWLDEGPTRRGGRCQPGMLKSELNPRLWEMREKHLGCFGCGNGPGGRVIREGGQRGRVWGVAERQDVSRGVWSYCPHVAPS